VRSCTALNCHGDNLAPSSWRLWLFIRIAIVESNAPPGCRSYGSQYKQLHLSTDIRPSNTSRTGASRSPRFYTTVMILTRETPFTHEDIKYTSDSRMRLKESKRPKIIRQDGQDDRRQSITSSATLQLRSFQVPSCKSPAHNWMRRKERNRPIDHFWNPYRVWVFKDRCRKFFFGTELQNGGSSAAALKPKNVAVSASISTHTSRALSYGIHKLIAYPPKRFVVYETHANCHEGCARNKGIFTFLELPSELNATISPLWRNFWSTVTTRLPWVTWILSWGR